jgi:hypothetical protein
MRGTEQPNVREARQSTLRLVAVILFVVAGLLLVTSGQPKTEEAIAFAGGLALFGAAALVLAS